MKIYNGGPIFLGILVFLAIALGWAFGVLGVSSVAGGGFPSQLWLDLTRFTPDGVPHHLSADIGGWLPAAAPSRRCRRSECALSHRGHS